MGINENSIQRLQPSIRTDVLRLTCAIRSIGIAARRTATIAMAIMIVLNRKRKEFTAPPSPRHVDLQANHYPVSRRAMTGPDVLSLQPTGPFPTYPGPGRDRTRPNGPTPGRNRPTAPNRPTANRPTQLGGTYRGAGRPGATNSKGLARTTVDAPVRPPAPGDLGRRQSPCNPVPGRRRTTQPAPPNGGRVGPSWRSFLTDGYFR